MEDGVLDDTEGLERASVSPSISCSDIYGPSLKEKGVCITPVWGRAGIDWAPAEL